MNAPPNGKPSELKMDASPLLISGQANVDVPGRVVSFPVRRRLDVSAQMVVLPMHVVKELAAMIIHAESQQERAEMQQQVRPAMNKTEAERPT